MPRPHIAILMEFPTALGGERSLLSILELLKIQFDFSILSPAQGELADLLKTCAVEHIPFSVRNSLGVRKTDAELLKELQFLFSQKNYQIVHGNSVSLGRFLGRHRSCFPQAVTTHLRDIMKFSARAIQDLACLDRLIAVSQATATSYRIQGLPSQQIEVIYNGIDSESFRSECVVDLRQELKLPETTKFAAMIGQIGLRKGFDLLVDAIPDILSKQSDWHFLMVGKRYSAKQESRVYVDQMLKKLKENGMTSRVHWLGYRTDVAGILQQTDLLIHPARQEPFGRVLLEAATCGTTIVASDVGGTSEMLVHQESAWLIPPHDVESIQNACNILMCNEVLCRKLGKQAQKSIGQKFTIEKSARAHHRLWDRFL